MSFAGAGGADFTVAGAINVGVNTTGLQGFSRGLQDMATQAAATGRSVAQSLSDIGQRTRSIGQGLTVGVTTPLVGLAVGAVKAGSDLHESMSAVETVFGDAAQSVLDFSKTSATALGQSQNATLGAASALGALFKGVGFSEKQMADFSKSTLKAASDLGSFYNVDPGTALQDIQSGLVGQSEPLRKYGILLSETAVQQKAMAQTGKTNASELTEQEKVAARYALIMDQLGAAQGDFARTSGGLANKQRILKAQLADTAATLGTQLLPLVLQGVTFVQQMIVRFQQLSPRLQRFALIGAGVAAAIGPLLIVLGSMATGLGLLLGPLGLVIAGIALLGIAYQQNILGFGDAVRALGGFLLNLARYFQFVLTDGDVFNDWLTHLPAPLRGVIVQVGRVINAFRKMGEAVGEIIHAFRTGGFRAGLEALFGASGRKLLAGFGDAISAPAKAIGSFLDGIRTGFRPLDAVIHNFARVWVDFGRLIQEVFQGDFRGALAVGERLLNHLFQLALSVLRLIPPVVVAAFRAIDWNAVGQLLLTGLALAVQALGNGALKLFAYGSDLLVGLLNGAVDALPGVLDWAAKLGGAILDAIGDFTLILVGKGVDLLAGLIRGIADEWTPLVTFVASIPRAIVTSLGDLGSLLYQGGRNLVSGLISGIASKATDLYDAMRNLAGNAKDVFLNTIGAHSPATEFIPSGKFIVQGIGVGLDREAPALYRSLHQIVSGLQRASGAGAPPARVPVSALTTRAAASRTLIIQGGIHAHVSGAGLNQQQIAETTAKVIMSKVRLLDAQFEGGAG